MTAEPLSLPSPNFDDRPDGVAVDMLVLHYTGMKTADAALARLRDADAKVSAHYVVGEDGTVLALVGEDKRAWHAGAAMWRGVTDINARSIGVELVNPGHEFGYRDFPDAQMAALIDLAKGIVSRHPVEARNVVGHSDVAPTRKTDPGERFDWARLARAGIGLWPGDEAAQGETVAIGEMLRDYGYDVGDEAAAVTAFQRHFRPEIVDGRADRETRARLKALLALCPS